MAAFPQTITDQNPVDLGGGFEDPMDPCTMCQQGQMEVQQAYNELTQTCNACQTQQNLKQLQTQGGCEGCQTAQKIIQHVQQQNTGCAACGMQPIQFSQLAMPQNGQTARTVMMPLSAGQPMLTPLTGTSRQPLNTVQMQPGMMAGQLPIAVEIGPTGVLPQNIVQPYLMQTTMTGGTQTMQPMVVGGTMMMMPSEPMQGPGPMLMPMQPAAMMPMQGPGPMLPPPPPPVMQPMQPVMQPTPIMQPTPPPPPPPPVNTPPPPVTQPVMTPTLTPAQIQAVQNYVAGLTAQGGPGAISIGGTGAIGGVVAGGGKAGPGSGTTIGIGPEGEFTGYSFGLGPTGFQSGGKQGAGGKTSGIPAGGTGFVGGLGAFGGVGGPGAFDTHRPDLHAGGGWHNTLPKGALENVFNLY